MENTIQETVAEQSSWTYWPWIVVGVPLTFIIAFLVYKRVKYAKQKKSLKGSGTVDMDNVMASSFKAKELYDKLKVKCHPDRFLEEDKKVIANEIAQEMNEHKYDYSRLCQLKERAQKELGVTI